MGGKLRVRIRCRKLFFIVQLYHLPVYFIRDRTTNEWLIKITTQNTESTGVIWSFFPVIFVINAAKSVGRLTELTTFSEIYPCGYNVTNF